jgi:hypothetical protein
VSSWQPSPEPLFDSDWIMRDRGGQQKSIWRPDLCRRQSFPAVAGNKSGIKATCVGDKPGFNALYQKEIAHGKKRHRTQQGCRRRSKPQRPLSGVYGGRVSTATTANTPISNGRLGRFLKGLPAVRITKTHTFCGQRLREPSVWRSDSFVEAWKIQGSTPNVRKS